MQSDKIQEKKSIFERLQASSSDVEMRESPEPQVKISKSSSIFNRLGSYKELDKKSSGASGILRTPDKVRIFLLRSQIIKLSIFQSLKTTFKRKLPPSKSVEISPKKISLIAKKTVVDSDDTPDDTDSDDDKKVSFSPNVEVRVYQPPPTVMGAPKNKNRQKAIDKIDGVKSRLGNLTVGPKTILNVKKQPMKPGKTLHVSPKISKMKSDQLMQSVHSRLDVDKRKPNDVKNFKSSIKTKGSSVFNRLGRN